MGLGKYVSRAGSSKSGKKDGQRTTVSILLHDAVCKLSLVCEEGIRDLPYSIMVFPSGLVHTGVKDKAFM